MSLLFPAPPPADAPRTTRDLMRQGKWWRTREGEWIKVKKMTPAHRANVARLLMRNAAKIEFQDSWSALNCLAGAPDDVVDEIFAEQERNAADPKAWIRTTKLYRRMVKGFAPDMRVDDYEPQFIGGVEYHAPREDMP